MTFIVLARFFSRYLFKGVKWSSYQHLSGVADLNLSLVFFKIEDLHFSESMSIPTRVVINLREGTGSRFEEILADGTFGSLLGPSRFLVRLGPLLVVHRNVWDNRLLDD